MNAHMQVGTHTKQKNAHTTQIILKQSSFIKSKTFHFRAIVLSELVSKLVISLEINSNLVVRVGKVCVFLGLWSLGLVWRFPELLSLQLVIDHNAASVS